MGDPPNVTSLESEHLGASHVKDLPPVVPSGRVLFSVRFDKVWPQLLFVLDHRGEPVLWNKSTSGRNLVFSGKIKSLTSQVLE